MQGNAKPDERKEGVRKPVKPTKILLPFPIFEDQIQPDVKELIRTDTWHEIRLEPARLQILKWCDAPSKRSLSQEQTAWSMDYPNVTAHLSLS